MERRERRRNLERCRERNARGGAMVLEDWVVLCFCVVEQNEDEHWKGKRKQAENEGPYTQPIDLMKK